MSLNKNLLPRLATCSLLLCSAVLTATAADATVQADGGLRMRSDASTTASILTVIPNNATVDVISDSGDGWYQVSYDGNTGYSSSNYIQLTSTDVVVPVEEVVPTVYIQVTEGPLNIRSGADTSFDKVGSLSSGAVAEVISSADGWYQISAGYVSADYVQEVDPSTIAASQSQGEEIANYALQYVGCKYVYGGTSPSGFDCSGFVQYVYKSFGITLNRTSSSQYTNGTYVSKSELQAGDVVFFSKSSSGSITHVGLYIGNNQFVHASDYGVGVIVSDLSEAYYTSGFVGGRRMI